VLPYLLEQGIREAVIGLYPAAQAGAAGNGLIAEQLRVGGAATGGVDGGLHAQVQHGFVLATVRVDIAAAQLPRLGAIVESVPVLEVEQLAGVQGMVRPSRRIGLAFMPAQRDRPRGSVGAQGQGVAKAQLTGVEQAVGVE
jgi:hypothetical protein